jgi:hypothetical protein
MTTRKKPHATMQLTEDQMSDLERYVKAGMDGLYRSRWRLGDPVEFLVAPIVLQVIILVSKDFHFADLSSDGTEEPG